ncbi:hypothetical protein ZWY2020_060015 [Hordeum vulgare]|nr:hypothetical protein ZWY2020_060015 [Hordeum vulgare]
MAIGSEWLSVQNYWPEDFLVVFARQENHNMVAERPFIESQGVCLFFRQWNRHAQGVHSEFHFQASLVLEGIPPHAWEREVAHDLLGTSCLVDTVAPESSSGRDFSAFRLSAWTANPEAIPSLTRLAIPEPGLKLALPLLKEVQASVFCPDADPYTPGRTTRAAKGTAGLGVTKETAAENLLLRTPGLAAKDLEVDDQAVEEHRGLFDSPLHEYHINVTAELFGKAMPTRENSRERMGC